MNTQLAPNNSLCDAAVEALVTHLPTLSAVTAEPLAQAATIESGLAVMRPKIFGFVGQTSADLVLQLHSEILQGAGALGAVSVDDILRPAVEAATGVLGTGVLTANQNQTAQSLLEEPATLSYRLSTEGKTVGFFALRIRTASAPQAALNAVLPGAPAHGEDVGSRLSRLRNVQMGLTVEIGRARVSVRDVLNLEPGAVIELDRNAGAPADVRLNGRLIAQGEVVVMDQEYGVRITKILDSSDNAQ